MLKIQSGDKFHLSLKQNTMHFNYAVRNKKSSTGLNIDYYTKYLLYS